jgi:FlaA1/EpsC-like NDP-sugar epimerase
MTPQVATRLKPDEHRLVNESVPRRRLTRPGGRSATWPLRELGPVDGGASAPLLRREALHRRLLGAADVVTAGLALMLVLSRYGQHHAPVSAIAGVVLIVLLFKVARLYDRDDLRLVHSTLDEVPALFQLTGLVSLSLAILQSLILTHSLRASQIAALWLASFLAIFAGRVLARAIAGRALPTERCLVIGEVARVEHIRQKLASSQARAIVVASLPIVGEDVAAVDWVALPGLFRRVVRDMSVHRIIIAPATRGPRLSLTTSTG